MTPLSLVALPFVLSLLLSVLCGDKVIAALAARKARQPVSGDAPASHQAKQGTPTMGGLLIIGATLAVVLVLTSVFSAGGFLLSERQARLFAVLGVFLFGGIIGLLDDLGKARKKQNKAGLSERAKLGLQLFVASAFVLFLFLTPRPNGLTSTLSVMGHGLDLGLLYFPLAVLYLCFFANAANFTDGLDGLAGGTTLVSALALGVAATGTIALEVGIFYGAVAGACAGFLWFNAYPARVFMGDTGSLALGMGLAAGALAAKQELLFLVVGGVYLAEIASMMIQRYVFKYRRIKHGIEFAKANRVFRRAPLHHHFEETGMSETQVVARFWVAALFLAALGLLLIPLFAPHLNTGGPYGANQRF